MRQGISLNRVHFAPVVLDGHYALAVMCAMLQTAWERRQLKKVEVLRLEDMGIDLEDARIEAQRPFWDLPAHQCERLEKIRRS